MPDRRLNASAMLDWATTAVGDLIVHTDEINRLNVFPVADSDTGANMLFTMRSALARAHSSSASGDVSRIAAALSDGALDGARGNSGIILSQILRAFAEVTTAAAAKGGGFLSHIAPELMADALNHSVTLVTSAMGGDVVAGTIVSVLQAACAAAAEESRGGAELVDVAAAMGAAAADALDKTTEQLDVLAKAGVVDAGGRGLLVLLDALIVTVGGQRPARRTYESACRTAMVDTAPPQFEVMYLLAECAASASASARLRTHLEKLGDSVVIASTGAQLSVHVHTDDAGGAIEAGLRLGEVSKIQISVLSAGPARPSPGSWGHQRAVLAVVDGDGAAQLFGQEGANVITPDPELPGSASGVSARQLLRALIDADAAQVLVLPNGYVAAEELVATCTAGIGWGIEVVPLPSGSMIQGLAALAVHDPGSEAVDDAYTMARAAGAARYGSVRLATEKALTWAGTCEPGDGLGIAGGEVLIVDRDVAAAGAALIDLFLSAGGELVTVLVGECADPQVADQLADHVRRTHLGVEFAGYLTGQRGDALLIGVE